MKIIKCLSEKIEDELQDASDYIELALKCKDEHPDTANLFYELSVEEMGHMARLHNHVEELIEEHREQIKVKQGMYKLDEE